MTFFVDGEDVTVVVDDWFPFYLDKDRNEKFAFARNKGTLDAIKTAKTTGSKAKGELWVQLIEKAWAKVCGSYEASEMGTAAEALNNIDGNPCQTFMLAQIEAKGQHSLLWSILEEADSNMYVATCSVDSTQRCNPEQLDMFGICDFHSYTLLQAIAVPLEKGSNRYRYLMSLRNPWGRKEWKGPWGDYSSTWERYPFINDMLRASNRTTKNNA